jgi:phospholipid transport system transporter-binding protein
MMTRTDEGWRVEGPVNVETAATLLQEAESMWEGSEFRVDLGGITSADSAAVAVLLAWRRQAAEKSVRMQLVNSPESVCSLARLYDVADLLFPG